MTIIAIPKINSLFLLRLVSGVYARRVIKWLRILSLSQQNNYLVQLKYKNHNTKKYIKKNRQDIDTSKSVHYIFGPRIPDRVMYFYCFKFESSDKSFHLKVWYNNILLLIK